MLLKYITLLYSLIAKYSTLYIAGDGANVIQAMALSHPGPSFQKKQPLESKVYTKWPASHPSQLEDRLVHQVFSLNILTSVTETVIWECRPRRHHSAHTVKADWCSGTQGDCNPKRWVRRTFQKQLIQRQDSRLSVKWHLDNPESMTGCLLAFQLTKSSFISWSWVPWEVPSKLPFLKWALMNFSSLQPNLSLLTDQLIF